MTKRIGIIYFFAITAALCIFLLVPDISYSDGEISPAIHNKISSFFSQLEKGEAEPAMMKVIEGSTIGQSPAQVQNLVAQISNAINLYGPLKGFQIIHSSAAGDSLIKVLALSKHTSHPLRWTFVYYRPDAEWVLINIEFDDQVDLLL